MGAGGSLSIYVVVYPRTHGPDEAYFSHTLTPIGNVALWRNCVIEAIYEAYPRHVGRRKALLEIQRALGRIQQEAPHLSMKSDAEIATMMLNTVKIYASSPAGKKQAFTPHPTTWFHQSRYLDDPEEWFYDDSKQDDIARRNSNTLAAVFGKLPDQNRTSVFACTDGRRGSGLERLPKQLLLGGD